jgi:hypothetical protein
MRITKTTMAIKSAVEVEWPLAVDITQHPDG